MSTCIGKAACAGHFRMRFPRGMDAKRQAFPLRVFSILERAFANSVILLLSSQGLDMRSGLLTDNNKVKQGRMKHLLGSLPTEELPPSIVKRLSSRLQSRRFQLLRGAASGNLILMAQRFQKLSWKVGWQRVAST